MSDAFTESACRSMYEMADAIISIAATRHLRPPCLTPSLGTAPQISIEVLDDLAEHVRGDVVLRRPGMNRGRRDDEIEFLSKEHQLFGKRHRVLEQHDIVLHPV